MDTGFYMIWRENGPLPACRHIGRDDATRELKRLCRLNPDVKFFLLRSVAVGHYIPDPVVIEDLPPPFEQSDEPPF